MPVGIQRLNARRTHPNPHIVFIKPLPGPDSSIAEKFLEKIAAQCLPIMKEHHLSVVTLEEYEPNREFVGRNFNAGEVIQLVLKTARAPHRWLPFRYVQMVMMHELAHCTQMNHSRAFWAVRNAYAADMTALWAKGYTGEGMWGRGAALGTGEWDDRDTVVDGALLPEHLCGGTYRSRRRKKRKPKLSWKEQKERRIAKKFGTNGLALGADEAEKVKLEGGKKKPGKPRVAGSARGRDLRAAAALARFDKQKMEDVAEELPLKDEDETASGSDYEEEEDEEGVDAVDLDGSTMKDKEGRALVKVCEDEDANDPAARNELDELRSVFAEVKSESGVAGGGSRVKGEPETSSSGSQRREAQAAAKRPLSLYDIPDIRDAVPPKTASTNIQSSTRPTSTTRPNSDSRSDATFSRPNTGMSNARPAITIHRLPTTSKGPPSAAKAPAAPVKTESSASTEKPAPVPTGKCPLCSLENDPAALSCAACANVLRPDAVKGSWKCGSEECKQTGYVNAGDCGVCGLCGGRRP